MRATGIIRRMDDLGRVVIPRELRRTMHLREGDPMEIYTEDGHIIFKKYSFLGVSDFAQPMCDALTKSTGQITIITDRDACVAVAGVVRREMVSKRISKNLEEILESRKIYEFTQGDNPQPVFENSDKYYITTAAPVVCDGEAVGGVLFVSDSTDIETGEANYRLAQVTAEILSRQLEV